MGSRSDGFFPQAEKRSPYEKGYQQGREDALEEIAEAMYHEAFEVDHEADGIQKWDGGNWIRYKLFENVLWKIKEHKND